MNDKEFKKVIYDSIKRLRSIKDMYKSKEKSSKDLINILSNAKDEVIKVKGRGDEENKSTKLKKIGLSLLSLPIDPTQVTTATGATLYLIGKVLNKIEEKTKGMMDIILYYNRFIIKLKEILS